MAYSDYFDEYDWDDNEAGEGDYLAHIVRNRRPKIKPPPICRLCGEQCDRWDPTSGRWKLFKNGKEHDCPVKKF